MKDSTQVILLNNDVEVRKDSILILGFTGFGLIGPYIAHVLIDNISDMTKIGYIKNEYLKSKMIHIEGTLQFPFNLYYSEKENIIIGISQIKIQPEKVFDNICDTIIKWAKSEAISVKEVVVFEGILNLQKKTADEERRIYFLSSSEKGKKNLLNQNMLELDKGLVKGITATFLNNILSKNVQGYGIFINIQKHPTYEGAINIVSKLNRIYELNLNMGKIRKNWKKYGEKLVDVFSRTKISYYNKKKDDKDNKSNYNYYL